jgi:cell division topological specificity factor
MGLLSFLFPERRNTAVIARERLKIVLAHERASREAPDFLPVLQKELLDVVGRYVEIRGDMIRVNLDRSGETSLLEINVEIDGAKITPAPNGAAGPARFHAPARTAGAPPGSAKPGPLARGTATANGDAEPDAPWVKPR